MSNDDNRKFNKWVILTFAATLAVLVIILIIVVVVDPLFHYHAPLNGLAYPLGDERYTNDGILRHFDYDSVIMGSSLSENFKTSEADTLFDANFVKATTYGALFRELNEQLERNFEYNGNLKYVIRGIDLHCICWDKDEYTSGYNIPDFLYNSNPLDDVYYIFNKEMIAKAFNVLKYTIEGNTTTSFDDYATWDKPCGIDAVLSKYTITNRIDTQRGLTDDERNLVAANITQNITALPAEHPETTFIYFFTPFSVAYWDELDSLGRTEIFLESIELAARMMLEQPNIKIYMLINDFDTVSNLDYYIDQMHYNADISSLLLEYMANGDYLVTEDNLDTLMTEARDFYLNYDYEALHDTEE
jgi:hypothetical protein